MPTLPPWHPSSHSCSGEVPLPGAFAGYDRAVLLDLNIEVASGAFQGAREYPVCLGGFENVLCADGSVAQQCFKKAFGALACARRLSFCGGLQRFGGGNINRLRVPYDVGGNDRCSGPLVGADFALGEAEGQSLLLFWCQIVLAFNEELPGVIRII